MNNYDNDLSEISQLLLEESIKQLLDIFCALKSLDILSKKAKVGDDAENGLIDLSNEIYVSISEILNRYDNKPKKIQTNSLYGEFRGKTNGKQD